MQKSLEALSEPHAVSIPLFEKLKEHIETSFELVPLVSSLFISKIDFLRGKRNEASHTSHPYKSREEASNVITKTEEFIQTWINAKS
jgi:hypothetical protein